MLTGRTASRPLGEVYGYEPGLGPARRPPTGRRSSGIMTGEAPQGGSAPPSPDRAVG